MFGRVYGSRNYLDWLLAVRGKKKSREIAISNALNTFWKKTITDSKDQGANPEFLAVRQLVKTSKGLDIVLRWASGVGKTLSDAPSRVRRVAILCACHLAGARRSGNPRSPAN